MSNQKEKNLFIVDHANKSGDRERRNPNRAARRKAICRLRERLLGKNVPKQRTVDPDVSKDLSSGISDD